MLRRFIGPLYFVDIIMWKVYHFIQQILCPYYVSGTVLGVQDRLVKKIEKVNKKKLTKNPYRLYILWGVDKKQNKEVN